MKVRILGSGGSIATPKIGCDCPVCKNARQSGRPYKRNSSSLFVEAANAVFDCPEDIGSSINENGVEKIDALFITHWHPDHCFGLRLLMQHGYDFYKEQAMRHFSLYIPRPVYPILKKVYPAISFQLQELKTAELVLLEDRETVRIKGIAIQPIGYRGPESDTFGYLIRSDNKTVLYTPCDTLGFDKYEEFTGLDLWITECGCFSDYDKEIGMPDAIARVEALKPSRTVFTHLEEEELQMAGWDHLQKLKKRHKDAGVDFAWDGMTIEL